MEFSVEELSRIRVYLGTALDEVESCITDLSADTYTDPKDLEGVRHQAKEIQAFLSRIDRAIA